MRKLNGKNKLFVTIFTLIILAIIAILIFAVKLSSHDGDHDYIVTSNTVIFATDTSLIDTSNGGKIDSRWDGEFHYLSSNNRSYDLGKNPVVYDKAKEILNLMGINYQVLSDGNIRKTESMISIDNFTTPYFYKLADRVYLIVNSEIYTTDKSIYASKYLVVNIDKQGNASVYNDSINVKTINPMSLIFGKYVFDIANEKLIVNNNSIDLKLVIGSTNEYVFTEKVVTPPEYDQKELVDSYNDLVNDFSKYANNTNMLISANNKILNNNTIITSNISESVQEAAKKVLNKAPINKRVSLRGCVASASYVDVTYIVTDPENKYQAVYLLVTGNIGGRNITEKILLDKSQTTTRINNLAPRSEYTISLGYIEVIKNDDEKSLSDNIEDIINVRTTNVNSKLTVDKISSGYVYFSLKMTEDYAFENAKVVLYVDRVRTSEVIVNGDSLVTENGFSSKLKLELGSLYELRVEEAVRNDKIVDYQISKKFAVS